MRIWCHINACRSCLLTTAAIFLAHQAAPALAQESTPQASIGEVGNIVVTARRREEKLQDVPLAISAIGGDDLQKSGATNLRDISYLTTGLKVNDSGAEFLVQPIIRGLTNLNFGGDPNVAVFLDGVYLPQASAINIGLIDMARVEVVKGPVSALYGRNAFAGAINYVTNYPGDTLRARANGELGSAGKRRIMAAISGPVIDDLLSLGISGGYDRSHGTYRDDVNGQRANGFTKRDIQGSFTLTPSSDLRIEGQLYYGKDEFANPASIYFENNCGLRTASVVAPTPYTQYCGKLHTTNREPEISDLPAAAGAAGNRRRVWNASLHLSYDTEWLDVDLLSGYTNLKSSRYANFTGRRNGPNFLLDNGVQVALNQLFGNDFNFENFSQELRFSSKQNQPFRWSFGGFYFNSKTYQSNKSGIDGSDLPIGNTLASTIARLYLTQDGRFSPYLTDSIAKVDMYSGFLGLDYDILPGLTISGEGRYVRDNRTIDVLHSNSLVSRPLGPPRDAHFSYWNYRGTAKYQIAQGVMAYASIASGTKSGGFNQSSTDPVDLAYDPENNTTYEIGLKSTLWNNMLQLNLAAYRIDTSDIQISGPSANPATTGVVTTNFGGTRINGIEAEANLRPMQGVNIRMGLAYNDAKFKNNAYDFVNAAACAAIPSCVDRVQTILLPNGASRTAMSLKGLRVPRSSPFALNFGLDVERPLSNSAWNWFYQANYALETRTHAAQTNFSWWGARNIVDINVGLTDKRSRIAIYVDNLLDDRTPTNAPNNTRLSDFVTNVVAYLPDQRTYGIRLSHNF